MSDCLWPHELQQARLPCLSLLCRICSNSCPLSQWSHPTISFSAVHFSSCLESILASGSFPMSQLFTSDRQRIGASAKVLSNNIQAQTGCWHLDATACWCPNSADSPLPEPSRPRSGWRHTWRGAGQGHRGKRFLTEENHPQCVYLWSTSKVGLSIRYLKFRARLLFCSQTVAFPSFLRTLFLQLCPALSGERLKKVSWTDLETWYSTWRSVFIPKTHIIRKWK